MRVAIFLCGVFLVGCQPATPLAAPADSARQATPITDAWLGEWTGPEGTSLALSKAGTEYLIEIRSLDGPAAYRGTAAGDEIVFERNGKQESIKATDGAGTGMKWLLDKKDCLTIQLSEGFCRD